MKKKYLVTGGLGFIGQAITKSLIQQNNDVIIVDNGFRHKNAKYFKNKNCKILQADIKNKSALKKIVKNIDVVIHLLFNFLTYFNKIVPYFSCKVTIKFIRSTV